MEKENQGPFTTQELRALAEFGGIPFHKVEFIVELTLQRLSSLKSPDELPDEES